MLLLSSCDIFKSPTDDFDLESKQIAEIIENSTDSIKKSDYFPDKDVREYLIKEFNEFYKQKEYKLAWVNFEKPGSQLEELLEAIDEAHLEGLDSDSYKVEEIEYLLDDVYKIESRKERRKRLKAKKSKDQEVANAAKHQDTVKLEKLVRLDFLITSSYLTYASHLLSGKVHPDEKEEWFPTRKEKDLASHLISALTSNDVKKSLFELVPQHQKYKNLKNALVQYRKIDEQEDKWSYISLTEKLKPGDKNSVLPEIKRRLTLMGDLGSKNANSNDSALYSTDLVESLKKFQARHGIEATGNLDKKTITALNTSLDDRLTHIKVNMDRMRWLPDTFGNKYFIVNIPEYMLRLYKGDEIDMEMKVIVGKTLNATPIFSDKMEYLVFSPTWTVPRSIAVEEMLPKLQEDEKYLTKKNFKLYDSWEEDAEPIDPTEIKWKDYNEENFNFRIVEDPGPGNALGSVKFIFPNDFDIYLHDTPAGHLFDRKERSFSHGCIRVEKPLELAEYLLKDKKNWDREKIKEAMNQEEPETVKLSEKIPVHLVYWTSWVDDNGSLHFRDDIYSRDNSQIKQMKEKEKQVVASKKQIK